MSAPLLTGLSPGVPAAPSAVARAIAHSLLTEEDPTPPPEWLLPGQHRSFRRVLAALRRYRGALLADPVGSGKTYVALAVAATLERRGATACLVPAALVSQWRAVAERQGIPVVVGSHEQASRGRLPPGARGLVIVDESHHFRNPSTRRYGYVAPWLTGRPVLLVSATPIVNRHADLAHQLRLGIRDDALAADGLISLPQAIAAGRALSALARVVIEERTRSGLRPARLAVVNPADQAECVAVAAAMSLVDQLSLSRNASTAALVRGVLHRAAGSSPAALLGALRRYRTLLLHARDALASGRVLGRAELRRFAGEIEEQLVLWSLIGCEQGAAELDLADIDVLESAIVETRHSLAAPDPKLERLEAILADRSPTIVFVARRETVRHLRDRLRGPAIAWCTGERAGLGASALPREVVLGWFGPDRGASDRHRPFPVPHLIATDVAAEGLDLQGASRVVHYDAPWTPMRLEQREGRALRLGSAHKSVEVIRFLPPPILEAALGIEHGLSRKARLPGLVGLGPAASAEWTWRTELAARIGRSPAVAGIGVVKGEPRGLLAGFTLHADMGGRVQCVGAAAGWMNEAGEWCEEPSPVARMLELATTGDECVVPDRPRVQRALAALLQPIRRHLSLARGRRWSGVEPSPAARRLAGRLHQLVCHAVRRREAALVERLERALAFTGGGHTAGEAMLVERLADLSDHDLAGAIARLPPPSPHSEALEVRLSGLVLFGE